jgi:acyl carrier protein
MISENDLLKLIQTSLKSKAKINLKSNADNSQGWDSLGQLSILTALDKKLKGKTSKLGTLAVADSVGKILKILKSNKLLK